MEKKTVNKSELWAITPEAYEQRLTLKDEECKKCGCVSLQDYEVKDGEAIIPVHGAITGLIEDEHDEDTSQERIRGMIEDALKNPMAKAIVLDVNSPGGIAAGTQELSKFIRESCGKKSIRAHISGMGCSAAYWIASSADSVTASPSATIGSIGVIYVHDDISGMLEQVGVERTYLVAGKYKALGAPKKLSAEDKKEIQRKLDNFYTAFTESVALKRCLSLADLETWAEGRTFNAKEAQAVGLIDATLPALRADTGEAFMADMTKTLSLESKVKEAVEQAEARVVAVCKAVCGESVAERLQVALRTGMTPEQIASAKLLFGQSEAKAEKESEAKQDVEAIVKAALASALQGATPVSGEFKPQAKTPEQEKIDLIKKIGNL